MIEVEIDIEVYLPCYRHILDDDGIDIDFIWGGRDSGKSKFVAQRLTEKCMASDYFRCLLIKETHESIKDAQWQMIKDVAEEWEVESLFKFIKSPLHINCVNKATFLARGMNEPGRIRSISNPSDAWVEEGNQISKEAFITLITSLRSNNGNVKLWFTFNPEANSPDYRDFWLYDMFFKKYEPMVSFTGVMVLKAAGKEIRLTYRSTHTTYHDNPYVTDQRKAIHESLQETNLYWYRVFTLGLWGNKENENPWAFAFNRQKHVAPNELFASRQHYLWLSFDFNRSPATCSVIQHYDNAVYVIETIKIPKSGTEEICDYILMNYPGFVYLVTGDYSGNTPSSVYKEEVTNYTMIRSKLRLVDTQLKVTPNPRLEKNQVLVNTVLVKVTVLLCPVKAKPLIFDMENVKKRADGTIVKDDRNDPAQQADALDTFRYFCNAEMQWVLTIDIPYEEAKPTTPQLSASKVIAAIKASTSKHVETLANGGLIECSAEEYPTVRNELLTAAGQWLEQGDAVRGQMALLEVKRLDEVFG